MVKIPPANTGDIRDVGSVPGLGRSLGGGHGYPLQYSFLENPMDRGTWQATIYRVAKNQTCLKRLSTCMHASPIKCSPITMPVYALLAMSDFYPPLCLPSIK